MRVMSNDAQTHDQVLIVEHCRHFDRVRGVHKLYESQRRIDAWVEVPAPDRHYMECALTKVRRLLECHPIFMVENCVAPGGADGAQLLRTPTVSSYTLLSQAVEIGAEAAVKWLKRVYCTTDFSTYLNAEVHGLRLDQRMQFSNGMCLVPFDELPSSGNVNRLRSRYNIRPSNAMEMEQGPAVAATLKIPKGSKPEVYTAAGGTLEETVTAMTLIGAAAPVVGDEWRDFADPELVKAEIGTRWKPRQFEGQKPQFPPTSVGSSDFDIVEKYLSFDQKQRGRLRLAVERLNLARRRISPGDKAIDGSICLEALLGDNGNSEMTYKISLRAALLLESDPERRDQVRKIVKKFYGIRSKIVHGQTPGKPYETADVECVNEGLRICTRIISKIVQNGAITDMSNLELGKTT